MASTPSFDVAELRALDPHEQVYWLIKWFETNFFDPEEERQSKVNRNYRWPPSGPIDPLEELVLAFKWEVSRPTLADTADQLIRRSSNWHSRPDEIPLEQVARSQRPFRVRDQTGMLLSTELEQYRAELLAKIDRLESAVADLQMPPVSYSHNGPPGPLEDGPVTRADIVELSSVIAALRQEAQTPQPTLAALAAQSSKLLAFAQKLATWSGNRTTKFVDAALDTAGKTAGAALVLSVTGLLPQLYEVAAAVGRFVEALSR